MTIIRVHRNYHSFISETVNIVLGINILKANQNFSSSIEILILWFSVCLVSLVELCTISCAKNLIQRFNNSTATCRSQATSP